MIVVVALAYAWTHRDALGRDRPAAPGLHGRAGRARWAVAGGDRDRVRRLPGRRRLSTPHKEAFPHGQIAEALGLVPRLWALEAGWPSAGTILWLVAGSLLAAALLGAGAIAARRQRIPRGDFLAAGAGLTLGGYAFFLLPVFTPYLTYKVLAYGAPFLVLLALSPLALRRRQARRRGHRRRGRASWCRPRSWRRPRRATTSGRRSGSRRCPRRGCRPARWCRSRSRIRGTRRGPLYYLRDHRLSVERPSFILTGEGKARDPAQYRHRPIDYVLSAIRAAVSVVRPVPES